MRTVTCNASGLRADYCRYYCAGSNEPRREVRMKQPYEPPRIEAVGTVQDLTLGNTTGNKLDDNFSVGTPFGDLTFS